MSSTVIYFLSTIFPSLINPHGGASCKTTSHFGKEKQRRLTLNKHQSTKASLLSQDVSWSVIDDNLHYDNEQ